MPGPGGRSTRSGRSIGSGWSTEARSRRRLTEPLRGAPYALVSEDGRADPALGVAPAAPVPALSPDDPALVLYTSGSTGRPRGVVQTWRNIDANSRSIVEYLRLGPDDRALLVLPLYYCYGRSVLQTHLLAGGSVFLDGRFAFPRTVLEALGAEGCTGFAGVPLTFEIIRRQVEVGSLSFPRLRYLTQAGGAMAPDTIDWVRTAFRPAELFVMYGQTEATARLAYLPPGRAAEKRGSIGIPIPGVELRVVDDEGRELPAGETGHLVARGGNVTPGYLDEPEETMAAMNLLCSGILRTPRSFIGSRDFRTWQPHSLSRQMADIWPSACGASTGSACSHRPTGGTGTRELGGDSEVGGDIHALVWSPDGKRLAASSADWDSKALRTWRWRCAARGAAPRHRQRGSFRSRIFS